MRLPKEFISFVERNVKELPLITKANLKRVDYIYDQYSTIYNFDITEFCMIVIDCAERAKSEETFIAHLKMTLQRKVRKLEAEHIVNISINPEEQGKYRDFVHFFLFREYTKFKQHATDEEKEAFEAFKREYC